MCSGSRCTGGSGSKDGSKGDGDHFNRKFAKSFRAVRNRTEQSYEYLQ